MRKDTVNTAFNELSVFLSHLVVTGTVPVIERTETEKAVYAVRILMAGIIFTVPVFEEAV